MFIYSEVKLVLIQKGSSLNCLRLLCHSFKYANKPVTTTERAASWINDPKSRFQYIRSIKISKVTFTQSAPYERCGTAAASSISDSVTPE